MRGLQPFFVCLCLLTADLVAVRQQGIGRSRSIRRGKKQESKEREKRANGLLVLQMMAFLKNEETREGHLVCSRVEDGDTELIKRWPLTDGPAFAMMMPPQTENIDVLKCAIEMPGKEIGNVCEVSMDRMMEVKGDKRFAKEDRCTLLMESPYGRRASSSIRDLITEEEQNYKYCVVAEREGAARCKLVREKLEALKKLLEAESIYK